MPGRRQRAHAGTGRRSENAYRAVDRFTLEVALLFFRMRAAAREYLGQGRHSTGRRSILKSVAESPQTVAAMARRRSVSRQHVQKLVDALRADGLVRTLPSPQDRRTRLVVLTPKGSGFLEELRAREVQLFARLAKGLPTGDFDRATRLIQEVRVRLESGWPFAERPPRA